MHEMPSEGMYDGPYVPFVRPAVGDYRKQVYNGAGWLTIPLEPKLVYVVWERHRAGISGTTGVYASLAGAKAAQNAPGAVWRASENDAGCEFQWVAELLDGHATVYILQQELKP